MYPERPDPKPLRENAGTAFVGAYVLGMGFTLTPEERNALIKKDKRNAQRIFPYLGGQEVNSSPTQDFTRYVISFGEMSLEEAEAWPDLLDIVREKVKPDRDKLRDNPIGRQRKARWWQFAGRSPGLYTALTPLKRCLVTARVSKHLIFSFQPSGRIINEKLYTFPLDHYTSFAVLQSRVHEVWARLLSSTLKGDLNYTASECFDTFPFPGGSPNHKDVTLEEVGRELYTARATYMRSHQIGLTALYNDPPLSLRGLHEAMDLAVLAAYGWEDVKPGNSREIVERLYELNASRSDAP